MSRETYTGLHSSYRPPPRWDGTPPPDCDNLPILATHWRVHGDEDGSLEQRIHEIIRIRAKLYLKSKWKFDADILEDCSTNAMLALGAGWDHTRGGAVRYVDMTIQNYYNSQVRRKIHRRIPQVSLDEDPFLENLVVRKKERPWEVPKDKWDELYGALSALERQVITRYTGKKGTLKLLAAELRVTYKQVDNAIERIKLKARKLGIMPPSKRKKRA